MRDRDYLKKYLLDWNSVWTIRFQIQFYMILEAKTDFPKTGENFVVLMTPTAMVTSLDEN